MIHINLTPNTEEGWADKVLKTNLWPINLDTWAALKASENEIFFVEDDVEPNTEGQLNDIPTKIRTKDQWFRLNFISGPQHQPHTLLIKLTTFGQDFFFNRSSAPVCIGETPMGSPYAHMSTPLGCSYRTP